MRLPSPPRPLPHLVVRESSGPPRSSSASRRVYFARLAAMTPVTMPESRRLWRAPAQCTATSAPWQQWQKHFNCTMTACFRRTRPCAASRGACIGEWRTCRSSVRTGIPIRSGSRATRRSRTRPSCCSRPDHYLYRMLYSQGVDSMRWASARAAALRPPIRAPRGGCSPSISICSAARRRAVAELCVCESVRLEGAPRSRHRRSLLRRHRREARAGCVPAARLFERFNIEVLATTESPVDTLDASPCNRRQRLGRARHHCLPSRCGDRSRARSFRRVAGALRRADRRGRVSRGAATWRRIASAAPRSRRRAQRRPITAIRPRRPRICRAEKQSACLRASRREISRPPKPSCSARPCWSRWRA